MIDFILANMWQAWVVVGILLLVAELTSGTLHLLCFSLGAIVTAAVCVATDSVTVQLLTFAIASALSLFLIRPVMVKHLHRGKEQKSNADALIGRKGRVSEAIPNDGYGRVAIDGDDWKAQSSAGNAIPVGATVTVVDRESLIITVQE